MSLKSWQDKVIYFILIDRFCNGDPTPLHHAQRGRHAGLLGHLLRKGLPVGL